MSHSRAEVQEAIQVSLMQRGLAPSNAAKSAEALLQLHPGLPATRPTLLFGRWYRWWKVDGQLQLHREVVPIFPDEPEPGACGDPECHVLHADPLNPIHPPDYVDSRTP